MRYLQVYILIAVIPFFLSGCLTGGPIRGDLFADRYSDSIYVNEAAGFKLMLPSDWTAYAHYDDMPVEYKPMARDAREYGSELALLAWSRNQLMGMRIIMEDTDVPLMEYFDLIKEINQADIEQDLGHEVTTLGNVEAIRWIMETSYEGVSVRYLEYQVHLKNYNVRITFWTPTRMYGAYSGRFRQIASTFQRTYP